MSNLSLQFIGELKVTHNGEQLRLPPSKKTRALLAYLALIPNKISREFLCELFWDIPDDPRGALRWSLSKLRKIVDTNDYQHIVADRTYINFDVTNVDIDFITLQTLVSDGLENIDTATLLDAWDNFQGKFLEGLELDKHSDFYNWRMNSQEKVNNAQIAILKELISRLPCDEAVTYARSLTMYAPADLNSHLQLIDLLKNSNQKKEAEKQCQLSIKQLKDFGIDDNGKLQQTLYKQSSNVTATERAKKSHEALPKSISDETLMRIKSGSGLVGREKELGLIRDVYQQVNSSQTAQLLLINGEAGIGKSKLLECLIDFFTQDTDAWFLKSEAFESEVIRPYAQWIDAFRKINKDNIPKVLSGAEGLSRDAIFSNLHQIVADKLSENPVVIVFDDIHWCDESSVAALHYILRMCSNQKLLVVATTRIIEVSFNLTVTKLIKNLRREQLLSEIVLEPLATDYIKQIIGHHAPGSDADKLSAECGGNPLFAIEICKRNKELDTSSSLNELIQERLSLLSEQAIELLQWSSILEPYITTKSLLKLIDIDKSQLQKAIEEVAIQGILLEKGTEFYFYHNLIKKAIYQSLPNFKRKMMHQQVAENLEIATAVDLKSASQLAHHAEQSGDPYMSAKAMISAGKLCLRFYANNDALNLADKGLIFAKELASADQVCLTIELLEIKWNAAPVEDWQQAAEQAVDLAEEALDYGALPFARLGYQIASYLRWENGHWQDAHNDSMIVEQLTRNGTEEEHIHGMAQSAKCLVLLERDLPKAEATLLEARSVAKRKDISLPIIPLATGMLRYYTNDFVTAIELLQEARVSFKALGDRINEFHANEYLTMVSIADNNFIQALQQSKQLLIIGEKLKEGSEGPFSRALHAFCQYALDENKLSIENHLDELRVCDAKHRLAYTLTRTALIDLKNDDFQMAITRAEEALEYTKILNRASERMLALSVLANAKLALSKDSDINDLVAEMNQLAKVDIAYWAKIEANPFIN